MNWSDLMWSCPGWGRVAGGRCNRHLGLSVRGLFCFCLQSVPYCAVL
jgi:hypothetical protein